MNKFPIRLQRLKALVIKEFQQIFRDPSSLLIAVIFPILLLFLYGYGVSLDLDHLKIGLIVEDHSTEAESLASCIRHSKFFDITEGQTKQELEKKLIAGSIHGIVTIPFYFQKYREMGMPAPIFAAADGESPNTANFFQNYVEGAWMNWRTRDAIETQKKDLRYVIASPRFWYNEELESHYFLIPGSIGIIMTLIGTLLTALVVAREWERGTIEALLSTPITMLEFLLAKILAYFCLGMFSFLFCFFASIFIFSVPYNGSVTLLILVSSLFLLVSLAGGLMISSFSKDQFIASQMAIMSSFLPAYSLSGFIFEVTSMPLWIQVLSEFIPAKYFVSCLQTLYLVGDIPNLIFSNLAYLFLLGCLPVFFIVKNTKKRLN
jgi:ABC-2 type transport system permease protein